MIARERYIEKVGLFYEKYGLPKMAGRVLGYLLSSESDNNTFDDLRHSLKASKGSISSSLNLLIRQEMIEKYHESGNRKTLFRISSESLDDIIEAKLKSIVNMKNLLLEGNKFEKDKNTLSYTSIEETIQYYDFLQTEVESLKEKWKNTKKYENE